MSNEDFEAVGWEWGEATNDDVVKSRLWKLFKIAQDTKKTISI